MDILVWTIIVIIVALIWVLAFDTSRFTVSTYEFTDSAIAKPLKAVFLSDLHCKMYGKGCTFLTERIRQINPDVILIGGDMITAKPGRGTEKVVAFLKELGKDFPIVYAFGNHELRLKIYPEKYGDAWEKYIAALSEAGISITENGITEIGDSGVRVISYSADRRYYKRIKPDNMDPEDIRKSAGSTDPSKFDILLAHNPLFFDAYSSYGAPLTLSGHVHGGLVRIPVPVSAEKRKAGAHVMRGIVSPNLRLFPKYDSGLFEKDGRYMIVSRGLGTHTFPIRIFNPGDLIVVDLKPENGV